MIIKVHIFLWKDFSWKHLHLRWENWLFESYLSKDLSCHGAKSNTFICPVHQPPVNNTCFFTVYGVTLIDGEICGPQVTRMFRLLEHYYLPSFPLCRIFYRNHRYYTDKLAIRCGTTWKLKFVVVWQFGEIHLLEFEKIDAALVSVRHVCSWNQWPVSLA